MKRIRIRNYNDLVENKNLIPPNIYNRVVKRIYNWVKYGNGHLNDNLVQKMYKYAEMFI